MTPAPIKPSISFEYLEKIDIRVGTILAVEDVANSDKLVRLKVDFGDHTRSILIGMKKERQNPKAEIEGKQALFVVNLESRKMAGELSEGMVFDIGYADKLVPVLACLKNLFLMEPALVEIRSTHTLRRFCKRRLGYRETIGSDFTPEEPLLCRTRQGSPESVPLQPRAFRGA